MRCFFVAVKSKVGGLSAGGQVVHDEPEDGAFAQRALHAEAEAVLLEDGLGDGKPQAGALLARIGAGAVIPVKDIGQILGTYSGAVVLDLHPDSLGHLRGPQEEDAVPADVVHGVAQ